MAKARRDHAPVYGMPVSLGFLEPPVRTLSPAGATKWLRYSYRWWAALAGQGSKPELAGRLRRAARAVHGDTRQMVEACALALETGHPVRLRHLGDSIDDLEKAEGRLTELRAIAELEAWSREGDVPGSLDGLDTRMRRTVERSLRAQERRVARLQRDAA